MNVLMLVISPVATDARVLREAVSLVGAGHAVHIIGRAVPASFTPPVGVTVSSVGGGSAFRREGAPSLGARPTLAPHVRAARWLLLPEHRNSAFAAWRRLAYEDSRGRAFDVVHAHDFNTLELGIRVSAERDVPLVYDTHELWSGRPRVGRPTPAQRRMELRAEGRWGRRAAAVITVGDGVGDRLRAIHGWRHVTVVRNTFPLETAPEGSALTEPVGLVYAGRIAPFRELETITAAARRLAPLPVTIVGPADETYLAGFDFGPATVLAARPVEEVDTLLREAGLALVTHSNRWENHRLAMPNKLFHAVKVGVPVVATDVPELRRVVEEHGLGTLYRPGDADSLVGAVRTAVARYAELRSAVRAAAPALSWERDEEALRGVYGRIAAEHADTPPEPAPEPAPPASAVAPTPGESR